MISPQTVVGSNRQSRIDHIEAIVKGLNEYSTRVLDLGCKNTRLGDVNVDLRGIPEIYADARHLPFKAGSFSMVVFTDVLEHLPGGSETEALREIWRILGDGGIVLLSTPRRDGVWGFIFWVTGPAFWMTGHRHYAKHQLRQLLQGTGFEIALFTTIGSFREALFALIAPILLVRRTLVSGKHSVQGGDYSSENAGMGYTHIVLARRKA